jgi:peptidoglycan/xylan/chitin deacetylase (PgdA/CDA1 family)/archaellum component FlaF (FlaF/FlaG flagellin family)
VRRPLLVGLLTLIVGGASAAGAQAAQTIVTLGFDDGLATQYVNRSLLSSRGLPGVFYINTGKLGQPGYMTWDQVAQMGAEGNEIGGHTVHHTSLGGLAPATQRTEICDDRTAIVAHGYAARSFAYPYGSDDTSAQQIAQQCGYSSARTTRGIDWPTCDVCAELIPPRNAFSSRALQMNSTVSVADMQLAVTNAEQAGGGWLQIVMHDICDGCDFYGVPAPKLAQFFDWLKARQASGTVVMTPAQVMGGGTPPPPPPPPVDTTAPTAALTAPADGATVRDPITLTADAADNVGVAKVEFLVNGTVVATDTSAPYSATWDPASVAGSSATIAVRATDAAGNATTSPTRSVTIQRAPPADTTAPTVALTAPANGAKVRNTVTLAANASDNVGVAKVELLVNGAVIATDTTAPYSASWNTANTPGTTAVLTARATDAAGNTTTSAARTVTIDRPDTTKPTVTITSPANNATITGNITVNVAATDNVGVVRVRFLVDGSSAATDTSAPYSASGSLARGTHTIVAEATDAAGNVQRSAAITVQIR